MAMKDVEVFKMSEHSRADQISHYFELRGEAVDRDFIELLLFGKLGGYI